MATRLWCEVVCSCCAKSGPGQFIFAGKIPRKALKRIAKDQGWEFNKDGDSYCATCVGLGKHLTGNAIGLRT